MLTIERLFDTLIHMATSGTAYSRRNETDPNADPALVVTDATIAIDHAVSHLPPKTALQLLEFTRRRIDATEARVLADRFEAGASDSDVEDMVRSENNTSKGEAKRRARRAKATNANPDIADRLEDGTLSTEQADVIASAAADTDGEAACDTELIDDIAATSPEQGKKKARKYVNDRKSGKDIQDEHDRQRRRRTVYRYRTKDGDHVLAFQGDKTTIDAMERAVDAQADDEYQADGGRDVPRHKHPRSNDQRRFDAAAKLLNSPSGPKARSTKSPRKSATFIITTTIEQLKNPDAAVFTTADGQTLPRSVIEELMWDASWIGQVYSANGELLWQGRAVRYATPAQVTGLIARDGGCVLCNAHPDRCEAHHCDPWEAPMRGETNIDRLALLCKPCHIDLHQRKRTLHYELKSRSWRTRKARWEEIPPDRPTGSKRPEKPARTKPSIHEARRNHLRNDPQGDRQDQSLF